MARTEGPAGWLEQIAEAGLSHDPQRLQLVLLNAIRSLRKSEPTLSKALGEMLAERTRGQNPLRWKDAPPPPTESEEGMALIRFMDVANVQPPVLSPGLRDMVDQFLSERRDAGRLLKEGFSPPSSVLLIGAPGTGKTMLASWLANQLRLPLVVQDLAMSISSLLGKTGFNLRRTLDYARATPCLLLLDEFDAIAKRRDDSTELGELKRIVNVLLKELETWPFHSVLVAATNHPDLLDPAINRRFHVTLHLDLPGQLERREIMGRAAGRFADQIADGVLGACAAMLAKSSGSDLDRVMQSAIRRHLSRNVPLDEALVVEMLAQPNAHERKDCFGSLIRALRDASQGRLTVRDIAQLVKRSPSTVQHHLKKEVSDG